MKRPAFGLVLALAASWCFAQAAPATSEDASVIGLVAIHAAGDTFTMGDGEFGPGTAETLSSDFFMSRFPVTNTQFGKFLADGGYSTRSYWTANGWAWKGGKTQPANWAEKKFSGADQPVVGVSWYEAAAYAEFAGKSLPTLYHWYMAAEPNAGLYIIPLSNFGTAGPAPVGKFRGTTSAGV